MSNNYEYEREQIMEIKPENHHFMSMPLFEMNREELLRVACYVISETETMRKKLRNAYNL